MTSHQFIVIMRWLLVPIAAVLGIIVAIVPSFAVNRIVHAILWSTGNHMPGNVFMSYYSIPVFGAFAAFLFVVLGTWAAPKHRVMVALILLIVGGVLAWICVGDFSSPLIQKGSSSQRMWQPFIGTCSGGVIACVMVYFGTKLRLLSRLMTS